MKALVLSLLAATAAMAGSASAADDLSYSYVQAAYTSVDFDAHGNREGNGIEASWGTSSGVHLFGGFDRSTGGDDDLSSEATSWHAGLGAVYPISFKTHLVLRVAYEKGEVKEAMSDFEGQGRLDASTESQSTRAEGGVRAVLGRDVEGWLMARYYKLEDAELRDMSLAGVTVASNVDITDQIQGSESTSVRGGVLWKFHPTWSAGAEALASSDFNGFGAFIRSTF